MHYLKYINGGTCFMIEVKNLVKQYGEFRAVNDISFTIEEGKIYGFLGPNGAGKSTTMNMITGYLSPTSGTVRVNGYDIADEPEKAKSQIGYLPEIHLKGTRHKRALSHLLCQGMHRLLQGLFHAT